MSPTAQHALIVQIDQLLPQTQCGLCGHRDGCLPYAKSIAEGEDANKCVPGGQPVADALAKLLNRSSLPAETSVWPVQADGRPQRMKAIIREDATVTRDLHNIFPFWKEGWPMVQFDSAYKILEDDISIHYQALLDVLIHP